MSASTLMDASAPETVMPADEAKENWKTKAKGLPVSWHSQGDAAILTEPIR
ncbi:hypothetical protein WOLCODRAFT_155800 [Wolfiporia cocos MD-104 SS10]|uniref:Uncharacterized protein n=1 Tax=Wolfiporia cocos (strain MD-104) TaxID=742152 RepID=A0A2H3IYR1_WOLCO|nr:hypothetical protein WOLCODRAFT_155800 [Wolfiporia cocos MD-104 SS10]